MSGWQKRFELYLKDDSVATRTLEKITGTGLSLAQVLSSLEGLTSPSAGRKARAIFDLFIPTDSQNKKLAAQCSKLQNGLERVYGSPMGICFPQSEEMLKLAAVLKSTAAALTSTNNSKVLSRFTEKRLWKGFPLEVLYIEFGIPETLSWEDWYSLYTTALLAHGVSATPPEPRSLEAKHRRFKMRNPGATALVKLFARYHANIYLRY